MSTSPSAPRWRRAWLAPAGAAIGLVASMCGIGGGLFAVPLLHFGLGLELRRAVATALVLVLATTGAATLGEALHADSRLELALVVAMALGSFAGAQLGFALSKRLRVDALRAVFVVVLLAAGARILLSGAAPADAAAVAARFEASARVLLYGGLTGVAGGALTPLLGIGGGLVFVPALYLGLPDLGFGGARACSLAAGAVAALRSTWLFAREGSIEAASGLWLAAGALVGSALGVLLVHEPGAIELARRGLGAILWLVALRFARDLWRARARATSRA